ncbi:MAG: tyrosine-type recombinase/integrase [Aurantimonas coralicida]|uniref:tyrosine-type recombinase/integrase n=1 Tax=Nisaea sp. TaxID=2024842 RepID=UPI003266DAE8
MSVFKRDGAKFYSYDFRHRGRRFSGSTGETKKREAMRIEEDLQKKARNAEIDTSKPLTFSAAASLYWSHRGSYTSVPKATARILEWLEQEIGKTTQISSINDAIVARLILKRRSEGVSPSTINRSVTEPLRAVLTHAKNFGSAPTKRINWRAHKLKEPQERVREASPVEEAALFASLPADFVPLVRFAILSGCRRAEIVGLTWTDVNFFDLELRVTGKGEISRTIPMTEEIYDLLWSLRTHHPVAVFTFTAAKTREGRIKGQRYPITACGLNSAWRRYGKTVLKDFRFHDTRHTAATRLVRATGNLKMAQHLLGHTTLAMTSKYAHVSHDDLRAGLEKVARARSATTNATAHSDYQAKALRRKGKSG